MKITNILIFFLVLSVFQSCDQLETELNELDVPNTVVADLNITLVSDDYDLVDKTFGNFNSEDEAKDLIPTILTSNYPQLGNGSSAVVNYDIYSPTRINNEAEFELTTEDYDAIGETFGTLSSDSDIVKAVEYKYPNPEANDVVTLTYEWYCGGCDIEGTLTSKVAYYDNRWSISYVPTSDDYTFMGQSFPNFDSRSTARERIAKILGLKYSFDDAGDTRTSVFTYTYVNDDGDRQFEDFLAAFEFDGEAWQPFEDVVQRTLQLGHDGSTWVPDNTVKYFLSSADYAAIGEATAGSNPGGSSSISQYSNFDIGLWSDDEILDAIGTRLLDLFPKVEGQTYLVSYDTWEPGAGVRTIHLIYSGGAYVLV